MDLEYALITSSSLPDQVRESQYYATLNKEQFLDLVDYSEVLVSEDKSQKVLLLMVAKGTAEQAAEDARIKDEATKAAQAASDAQEAALTQAESEKARLMQEEAERLKQATEDEGRRKALRQRSRSIINGLYDR